MHCNLTERVSLLIDGELASNEAISFERHLLECAECQAARADFLSLRNRIGDYPSAAQTSTLRPELARLLTTRDAARIDQGPGLRVIGGRRFSPPMAAVFATVLILCAIAAALYFGSRWPGLNPNSPKGGTVAEKQTDVTPSGIQPKPVTADPKPQKPNNPEAVLPQAPPGRRADQRSGTASLVNQPNTGTLSPRRPAKPRTPLPIETSAPAYVAVETRGNDAASIRHIQPADTETLTVQHLEQSELLLRAFRNVQAGLPSTGDDLGHERQRAQQLFYQNVLLRREADAAGDVQVATLLESLEPILLDIANLSERATGEDVRAIKERVNRQNLVALLQINSTSLARAYE